MNVGLIKPIPLLGAIKDHSPYHLILNSLVLSSEQYRAHYAERVEAGDHVILDNDAWEQSQSASLDALLAGAELLRRAGATRGFEMVVPDVLEHAVGTVMRTGEALECKAFMANRGGCMIVPHGCNATEWCKCLQSQLTMIAPYYGPWCIGVPRCAEKLEGGIPHAVRVAHTLAPLLPIHLLGWGADCMQWRGLGRYPWIRGIDTAKPVSMALQGQALAMHVALHPNLKNTRFEDYFVHADLNEESYELIVKNVSFFESFLHRGDEFLTPFDFSRRDACEL